MNTSASLFAAGRAAGLRWPTGAALAKLRVVTTVQTFRALAADIGGDKVEVTALVGEAVDPHKVDPRPSYAVLLNRADLLVHVGLDLEKAWLPPLVEQSRNPRIQTGQPGNLNASTVGIAVLDASAGRVAGHGRRAPDGQPALLAAARQRPEDRPGHRRPA